jgi:LacI family transcriptional regulator
LAPRSASSKRPVPEASVASGLDAKTPGPRTWTARPTIDQVARLAGVAASSVSRVLNGHPDVSPAMRDRVMSAAEALRYEPDFVAQSLRRGATESIGFIVRDIANPLFADIVKGAEQELEVEGYSMLLMNSLGDPARDAMHLRVLRQRRVDGLILSLQSETNPDTRAALRETSAPIVLVDREVDGLEASAVLSDHFSGVTDATRSLLELGHRRLVLIGGPPDVRASRERRSAFEAACRQANLALQDYESKLGTYTHDFGYETMLELLDSGLPPTAVIASGVQVGSGVLRALDQRGLIPGTDISVVVCDEVEFLRLLRPAISVISRDGEAIGAAAARLLVERMKDADAPVRIEVLPTHYVARDSSAPPPGADP